MLCRTAAGEQVDITNPAILAFVSELGLVPGSPPSCCYTPDLFCDLYHRFLQEKKRARERLLVCYYERNKKYSKAWRDHYGQIVYEPDLF